MENSGPRSAIVRVKESPRHRESRAPAPSADYNLRILWTLARYVEDTFGEGALRDVAAAGGVAPGNFEGNFWVGAAAFEAILASARARMKDDEEFKRACVYRIKEAYGPLRYILWATSVPAVFAAAAKQYVLMSRCGELTVVEHSRTSAHVSFRSTSGPYSRINCLARQAQSCALPTFWGLPPAYVRESACIARGDATCELHYHWYVARRWLPVVAGGLLLAALAGVVLTRFSLPSVPTPVAMALVGAVIGYLLEMRRAESSNEGTRREVMEAFQHLAREEAESRNELLQMHDRQKEWTRLVEEEMSSRAAAIQQLASGVEDLHQARASTLLGFSHDLRNPLQIIQMSAEYLSSMGPVKSDTDAVESLHDITLAVDRMRRMLGDLMHVTKAQRDFVTMAPQRVETRGLTDALRRRLRALSFGSAVRTTVFKTREAPDHLEIDPLALDRIIDNLLTNAIKYTDRGSIVLELDGTPGFLVIKVSDTGRGIEPDSVDRIFEAGGSSPESRRGDSFGVGLSVVVQLLDQIGGRLEVMSKPGSGTTFWVYLPVAGVAGTSGGEVDRRKESTDETLRRVVRIRTVQA
jgi:signal transduction histidine kinase